MLCCCTPAVVQGQSEPLWKPFGPGGGGWIEDVVAHPTNPKEAWCTTDLTGLFQTRDGGETWHKRAVEVEFAVMARKQIPSANRQFAIDPKDPRHMYWGVVGMVWASHDGGESWCDARRTTPSACQTERLYQRPGR